MSNDDLSGGTTNESVADSAEMVAVVGLDAASDPRKFGYATGYFRNGSVEVSSSGCLGTVEGRRDKLCRVVDWILGIDPKYRILLAIDAPLGWPSALSDALKHHVAGKNLTASKETTFRRLTERNLRQAEFGGHAPLEVAADRIARAAHEALSVLDEIRTMTGLGFPLAWTPGFLGNAVIEVYPAASLKANGLPRSSYKKREQGEKRKEIAARLVNTVRGLDMLCEGSADIFDAGLCLLAAADFLSDKSRPPPECDFEIALREGWIWVKQS